MSTLDEWTEALCAELGLDAGEGTQKTVLNLARVAAHTVDRPAAADRDTQEVGGQRRGEPLPETAARLQQLARNWRNDHPSDEPGAGTTS